MPWVLSGLFHVGLFLIMAFVFMIVRTRQAPEVRVLGPNIESPSVTYRPMDTDPAERTDLDEAMRNRSLDRPRTASLIDSDTVTDRPVDLIGIDGVPTEGSLTDADGGGDDPFPPPPPGSARDVVYVIDCSGSMAARGVWDLVRRELLYSIGRLDDTHRFHVILFAEGQPLEPKARRLAAADRPNKLLTARFLMDVRARGRTDPLAAVDRAFDVLADSPPGRGRLMYLLTDADFPDPAAVIRLIERRSAADAVMINTTLFGDAGPSARETMRDIARETGGLFRTFGYESAGR